MKSHKQVVLGILLLLIALIISNPSERHYLDRIMRDYGMKHPGLALNQKSLLHIGTSHRNSYLFFSNYTYQFGTIRVSYFGIGSFIFYLESSTEEPKSKPLLKEPLST